MSNLERVFEMFGWEVDASAAPGMQTLEKEGKANAKKTNDAIVDSVFVQNAIELEDHETAV